MHFSFAVILGLGVSAQCVAAAAYYDNRSDISISKKQKALIFYVSDRERGILTVQFDPSKPVQSSLSVLATNTQGGFQPNWIMSHDNKIYTVSRSQFPTVNSSSGGIFSFQPHNGKLELGAKDSNDFGLTALSNASSEGFASVACDVSKDGRTIASANIDGASISIHPLSKQGIVGQATYVFNFPNPLPVPGPASGDSQLQSNPHQASFDPSGKFIFSPDRGADLLRIYSVNGPWDVFLIQTITLLSGSGPRHLTFRVYNETRTYLYVVSEIDNTIRIYTLDYSPSANTYTPGLAITLKQTISTISAGHNRTAPTNALLASEIGLSTDGKFAYATNRNTLSSESDTIAIFAVSPGLKDDAAHFTYLSENKTFGKIPRHFALSNDKNNKYVAITNGVSGIIVVLERDEKSGLFKGLKGNLTLNEFDYNDKKGPTAVLWA